MKVFVMITLLLAGLCAVGCRKNKPPTGAYVGTFHGVYDLPNGTTQNRLHTHNIHITESTKEQVIFESGIFTSILSKNKNNISGTFDVHPTTVNGMGAYQTEKDGPITIIGTLKKRNGKFVISGTYESTFTDEGNLPTIYSYPVSGTFEMVQK